MFSDEKSLAASAFTPPVFPQHVKHVTRAFFCEDRNSWTMEPPPTTNHPPTAPKTVAPLRMAEVHLVKELDELSLSSDDEEVKKEDSLPTYKEEVKEEPPTAMSGSEKLAKMRARQKQFAKED